MAEEGTAPWSAAQADSFERAYDLLGATIAGVSAHFGRVQDDETRERLRVLRERTVTLQRRLRADDVDTVAQILAEYPETLRRVRAGEL